jgi:hypothetical protein
MKELLIERITNFNITPTMLSQAPLFNTNNSGANDIILLRKA